MPVFKAIKQWRQGQLAASPGLLFNLLMMVRLEHLQGDALHLLLQDELVRGDVQCSQLVAMAALQIAGTTTDSFPCRPVRSFSQVQIQVLCLSLCYLYVLTLCRAMVCADPPTDKQQPVALQISLFV